MIIQDDIIEHARATLGTPYQHQGRINGLALDCIGVAIYVAKQLGMEYIDLPAYGASPHNGLLEEMMDKQPCLQRVYDMQPGDVLQMRFLIEPQHVAIWTGETIIHCSRDTGRVVECRLDDKTRERITKVYRFKPLLLDTTG